MELSAEIKYGGTKKACIGRVTGPDPKWGLALSWLGTRRSTSKSGRTGYVSALVDEPGLYVCIASNGDREHWLVCCVDGDLVKLRLKESTAREIARDLSLVDRIAPFKQEDGTWSIRDDAGKLNVRANRDALLAEAEKLRARLAEIEAELANDASRKLRFGPAEQTG